VAFQLRKREVGRGRCVARLHARGQTLALLAVGNAPAEEREQECDDPDRGDLQDELAAPSHPPKGTPLAARLAVLGADDEDRRAELDPLEQPFGVGHEHADAPVRC
jgi:hypothetical protein